MAKKGNINCWEFKKCGMDLTLECPAYPTGGRICYMLAGTLCGGRPQGKYAEKSRDCMECDFSIKEILRSLPGPPPEA